MRRLLIGVLALALVCCVGDSSVPTDGGSDATSDVDLTGTEGHACFANQTCNTGLTCASNVCVYLDSGADASSDGGGADADAAAGVYVIATAHANGTSPVTIPAFDTGTGANRLLVVGVSLAPNGVASSPTFQVTFNNVGLTSLVTADRTPAYDCSSRVLFMKAPVGAADIVVKFAGVSSPEYAVVGALALGGVNQTTTFGTPVTSQGNQVSMALAVGTGTGHMTFANNCNSSASSPTLQAGATSRWLVNANNMGGAASTGQSSTTVNHGWVLSVGGDWATAGVDILPAP